MIGKSIAFALGLPFGCCIAAGEWQELFNGRDLTGWSVTIAGMDPGKDPANLVQVHDGAIHMYREADPAVKTPFGVVTHEKEFANFELSFEYRWMGMKFPPRADALRDAGVIYHVKDASSIWPDGVEFQVQEGDTGDLVLIHAGALTWMQPDKTKAPEGQGEPGLLPENGGIPISFAPEWPYIGRFPVADRLEGWNQVSIVVRGSEYAEHIVNGQTRVRLTQMIDRQNQPLASGKLCFQLEGAEIAYRAIRVRELTPGLVASQRVVSLSAVAGKPARRQELTLTNSGASPLSTRFKLTGNDADAFALTAGPEELAPGATATWSVTFKPTRGAARYSAGIQFGDATEGVFVVLQGIGLAAFEGENEPPLQRIVHALGIPLDVGGSQLSLDTKAATIGQSIASGYFKSADGGKIRITPLARFSPPGSVPIGIFTRDAESPVIIGHLADSIGYPPDAHQSLFPPWEEGGPTIEADLGNRSFGLSMDGHLYRSSTDPTRPTKAAIPHTARIYPVTSYQGAPVKNTWLVGFEEASNGDYQDAVLMLGNVVPADP